MVYCEAYNDIKRWERNCLETLIVQRSTLKSARLILKSKKTMGGGLHPLARFGIIELFHSA